MRVVAGKFKGRRLVAPKGNNTRPTTDRTRENLFNILNNITDFEGKRILDLFSGTGALGIETLSRGAGFALFVETDNAARAAIRTNVDELVLFGVSKIFKRDAMKLGDLGKMQPFDIAFADPPYSKGFGEKAARELAKFGWLNRGALFILEEDAQSFPETLEGYSLLDIREYGNTKIGIFKFEN